MPIDKAYVEQATVTGVAPVQPGVTMLTVAVPSGCEAKVLEYAAKMWQTARPRRPKEAARKPQKRSPAKAAENIEALRTAAKATTSPTARRKLLQQVEEIVDELAGTSSTDTDVEAAAQKLEKTTRAATIQRGLTLEKAVHTTRKAVEKTMESEQAQTEPEPGTSSRVGAVREPRGRTTVEPRFFSAVARDLVQMGEKPRPPAPRVKEVPTTPPFVHKPQCDIVTRGRGRCDCNDPKTTPPGLRGPETVGPWWKRRQQ